MIYSKKHDFVFLHCPRTSGTSLTKSLHVLVDDAVIDILNKHCVYSELPAEVKSLRAFTILRPVGEVRVSYYKHICKWYENRSNNQMSTRWLIEHAQRLSRMTLDEYLASNEPPLTVNGYSDGCKAVFQYHDQPYDEIANFCRVDAGLLKSLMGFFRDKEQGKG